MQEENEIAIKIPNERIAILIGKNHEVIKQIEKEGKVKIIIDRANNIIKINGKPEDIIFVKDVVKAIGRGFNPKIAMLLLKKDYMLEIINLDEYFNTENAIKRVCGRIIGKKGSTKKEIENKTDSYISVYGSTIAIIAKYYTIQYAKESIEKLIKGAKHSTVYNYLSKVSERIFYDKMKGTTINNNVRGENNE